MQNRYPLFSWKLIMASLSIGFSMFYVNGFSQNVKNVNQADTAGLPIDSLGKFSDRKKVSDLNMKQALQLPFSNMGQFLQSNVAGFDYRRTTGEPGAPSSILIRGTSTWFLNGKSSYYAQPVYVIDGVPMIVEHPFAFDIKQYDYERIGPNTDISSILDLNDIASVRVLKNSGDLAKYGTLATNGVIEITTKRPYTNNGRVSINSYFGFSQGMSANTVNAAFENDFRMQFYNKYATTTLKANYPVYLSDSSQPAYYGAANWDDLYYNNSYVTGNSFSISGGKQRANFSFGVGQQKDAGIAEKTGLDRYNVYLKINILPIKDLEVFTSLSGSLLNRKRNQSLLSRYVEEDYLPDLSNPLPPNKDYLGISEGNSEKLSDVNKSTYLQGQLVVKYNLSDKLQIKSLSSMVINDNTREYFVPGSINEGNSFISYYTGFDRRVYLDNSLSYHDAIGDGHSVKFSVGQTLRYDKYKYDYTKAYRGPSDFIKIIKTNGYFNNTFDPTMVYAYKDYINQNVVSFYGTAGYNYKEKYGADLIIRTDGNSSLYQNGTSWFFSPSVNAYWNVNKEDFFKASKLFSELKLFAGFGRTGKEFLDNNNGYGPGYTVDIGWTGSQNIPSYAGIPTLSLPFSRGYSGFGLRSAYTEQFNAGVDMTMFNKRLNATVEVYDKTDKNLTIQVPVPGEYGFSNELLNGMKVRNRGVELTLSGQAINSKNFKWTPGLVLQNNSNALLSLPNQINSIVSGNRRIMVGMPIDNFWLLQNEGIYKSDSEIPVNPATGKKLSYNGIPFAAGDPIWKDRNGDYVINDNDKVLKGHVTPVVAGGFSNLFSYKKLSLSILISYALGRDIINTQVANHFDFVNREGADNLNGIKEITFWSKTGDYSKYPIYNPWSSVNPYQADQTLFLENGSYAKLRSATLSYDLSNEGWAKRRKISNIRVYATGTNLFTITKYTGADPELVDYMGYDTGNGMRIPRIYTIGLNLTL